MKVVVFAIGCGIAGIAGGLYAFYFQYVSPEQFEVLQSAAMLTMVVLGGMGTTWARWSARSLLLAIPQAITFLDLPPSSHGADAGHHLHHSGACCSCSCARRAWSARSSKDAMAGSDGAGEATRRAGAMSEVLRVENLDKAFGGIVVADNVNLEIDSGRDPGPDRPERRRQDLAVQPDLRRDASRMPGRIYLNGAPHRRHAAVPPRAQRASRAPGRTCCCSRTMTVMENLLIAPRSYPGESIFKLTFGRDGVRQAEAAAQARAMQILERMGLAGRGGLPWSPICRSGIRSWSACRAR